MREAKPLHGYKKAIGPLGIVALFLSIAQVTAVTVIPQTTGHIQVAFTTFAIAFPIITASAFFITLWRKNHVFYAPGDFESSPGGLERPKVKEYVEAMQLEPALSNHFSSNQDMQLSTKQELEATDKIVDTFIKGIDLNGLLCLYAFYLASKTMIPLDVDDLTSIGFEYAWGILTTTTAVGLIDYTSSKRIVCIIYIDEKLSGGLRPEIDKRIREASELNFQGTEITKEAYLSSIQNKLTDIERYYGM